MKALRLHAELLQTEGSMESSRVRSPRASATWKNARLIVEELPVPQPGPEDILLRVSYSGLGGRDFLLAETGTETNLGYPGAASLPVTLGHEFSGVVAGYGPAVGAAFRESFPVGAAVTAEHTHWCGACGACRSGHLNQCENLEELGFTSDGAHAEYVTVPAKLCWSLAPLVERSGMDQALRLGSLVAGYGVVFRALFSGPSAGEWVPGERVLVIGGGPVGLAAVDLALAAGAAEVQVLEVDPNRRHTARELGAALALAPEDAETLAGPFHRVIDAAGAPELVVSALGSKLAPGAVVSLLARTNLPTTFWSEQLITRNATLAGSQGHAGQGVFERVIRLMAAGRLHPEQIVRETITLDQALQRLVNQKKSEGKILVQHGNA